MAVGVVLHPTAAAIEAAAYYWHRSHRRQHWIGDSEFDLPQGGAARQGVASGSSGVGGCDVTPTCTGLPGTTWT